MERFDLSLIPSRRRLHLLLVVTFVILEFDPCTAFRNVGVYQYQRPQTIMCWRQSGNFVNEYERASTSLQMWSQDNELQGSDRIKACVPYLLPLIDGNVFGHYIYERIPILGEISDLFISPLVHLLDKFPFANVLLFVALTLGTRFNLTMNRNVRFSAQQAALIDVALLIPEIVRESAMEEPVPRYLAEPCSNFVWYVYMTAVVYCVISNLQGRRPDQIPYLSEVSDLMVGPF